MALVKYRMMLSRLETTAISLIKVRMSENIVEFPVGIVYRLILFIIMHSD